MQEVESNMLVNVAWLSKMDDAVSYLSSQCPSESDVLNLRCDADTIRSLSADVSTQLQRLRSTDTTEVSLKLRSQRPNTSICCSAGSHTSGAFTVVVVVIAQQLFSYHQLTRLKSATAAGLSHRSCTVSCVGWL